MSAENDSETFVDLARIASPVEADLFAMYLDSSEIDFQMLDRTSAPVQASMLPMAQRPVTFRVRLADLVRARELVAEYDRLQSMSPSSDPPPSADED